MLYSFDHNDTETEAPKAALPVTAPAPGEATDEQLMLRIQQGDEDALALLHRRHVRLFRTIVNRVLNNDTDTDDSVQEILTEVWRLASHYSEEKGKALGWLVTLARRRAIDKLRKKQAYQRAEERLIEESKEENSTPIHEVHETPGDSDRAEILQSIISTLPKEQAEALKLAFFRGLSQREIAAQTGTPLGTIKTRLELAVKKVRVAVLSHGGEAEWRV